jgi:hypothetical protein
MRGSISFERLFLTSTIWVSLRMKGEQAGKLLRTSPHVDLDNNGVFGLKLSTSTLAAELGAFWLGANKKQRLVDCFYLLGR